jgi:gamma-glutamyltranspeptidase/glutathione hydrolase
MFVQTPARKRPAGEIDFRAVHADFGTATQEFHIGAGAIAAPCLAAGLWEAHARLGRIPFRELARPAAEAARAGVAVTPFQARLGRIIAPILTASAEARALFCGGGEAPLAEGAPFRNAAFAEVLEEYAAAGPRFVREGEVAAAVAALAEAGGHLDRADLARAAPVWRAPLPRRRGGAALALNPPPALGGALVAFPLALLETGAGIAETARAFEATTRARLEAGLDAEPETGAARLADPALLARYRAGVAGRPVAARGTTHISAIDREGLGVALTLSNGEGCGLVAPGTGIMPNNMLGEADLLPHGFEAWAPGRRLASMMAPTALDWGDGRLAMLGSGGSNRIRSALARAVLGLVDAGASLEEAVAAPRLHVEAGDPPAVDFEEPGLAAGDRAALLDAFPQARGWPEPSMFFGGVHGVMREAGGGVQAAGDPRRDGHAIAV